MDDLKSEKEKFETTMRERSLLRGTAALSPRLLRLMLPLIVLTRRSLLK